MIQDSDIYFKVNTAQYGKRENNSEFTTISLIFTLVQDYNQVSGKLIHVCHIFM